MIKILLKIQARALLASLFKSKKSKSTSTKAKKATKNLLIAALAVYVVAALMFSIGAIFYFIYDTAAALGQIATYFHIFAFTLLLLCLIGSIFTAQNQLFEAKDNELLLSMPIRPRDILFSRFLLILLTEYVITFSYALPVAAIYCWFRTPTLSQAIIFVLSILVLPFFSLAIGCILGWLMSLITTRMRHKSLFYVPLFIACIGAYMYFVADPVSLFSSMVASDSAKSFFSYIPPIVLFGKAVTNGNFLSFLYMLLWCVLPLAAVLTFFAKRFIQIATTRRGLKKREYIEKTAKPTSPLMALTKKELRRFFSLPNYIINSALGVFMELLFCGYLIISKDGIQTIIATITEQGVDLETITPYIGLITVAALTLAASQSVTTACSISLEGDRFWILKTLPVSPKTIFLSKISSNLIIGFPPLLLSAIICTIVLPINFAQTVFLFLVPLCALATFSLLGLATNVRFPRFDWVSETVAIKQNLSVFISMMGSLVLVILPVALYFICFSDFSPTLFLLYYLIYFLLIAAALCIYLFGAGQKRFNTL